MPYSKDSKRGTDARPPEFYMKKALNEAKKAYKAGEVPVGAVVVSGGEVIASAHNTVEKIGSVLGHAEIQAIKKAEKKVGGWRLSDCDIYVTLEPCPMCAGAIVNSRIKNLYYGASDDKACSKNIFESEGYNHKVNCFSGIMKDECLSVIKDFFAERRSEKLK
ncbi:MAG: nucleoside deaminase [Clostridiales bacterium]|jgi:tRNA(adenine34) deaminase|nr:nucleoside deaminase [Clostridiales bacterium]